MAHLLLQYRFAKILFFAIIMLGFAFIGFGTSALFLEKQSATNPDYLAYQSIMPQSPQLSTALKTRCDSLTLIIDSSNVPKFAGLSATLVYGCSKNGLPAFSTGPFRSTQAFTPRFTLPSGWSLSIGFARHHGDCSSSDGIVSLSSGTSITLPAKTSYIYCLTTNSASNFSSFTISWAQ